MTDDQDFEIFLATAPGLEPVLAEEVRTKGFKRPKTVPGGVVTRGRWPEVWRANLWIRGAGRVLARIDAFHVTHLAHLDARARRIPWATILRPDIPFRVEATCAKSRIYHSGAAAERIGTAIRDTLGAPCVPDAEVTVMARIDHDLCTISIDTSGEPLHKRGYKEAVNPAPLRETMASLFLRQCGFDGGEPVLDPMCGSGTFLLEAAQMSLDDAPGLGCEPGEFGFERLRGFDAGLWRELQKSAAAARRAAERLPIWGSDISDDAVARAGQNLAHAGLDDLVTLERADILERAAPSPKGILVANPPYGERLGEAEELAAFYPKLGTALKKHFAGWDCWFLSADTRLPKLIGLKPMRKIPLFNGNLECRLYGFRMVAGSNR